MKVERSKHPLQDLLGHFMQRCPIPPYRKYCLLEEYLIMVKSNGIIKLLININQEGKASLDFHSDVQGLILTSTLETVKDR